jgi:hypothetical protein
VKAATLTSWRFDKLSFPWFIGARHVGWNANPSVLANANGGIGIPAHALSTEPLRQGDSCVCIETNAPSRSTILAGTG